MAVSDKQRRIMAFPYTSHTALICDGAVRTGKTSIMFVTFVDWAMRTFDRQLFGVCGKTIGSAVKNILDPWRAMRHVATRYRIKWRRSDSVLDVWDGSGHYNRFEFFGGKDEASQSLIQGRTLASVFLDEVALMPQSFVHQALARCSVDGARFWFSCNPAAPGVEHWFYKEWIADPAAHDAEYLHFELDDNPALSPATLARYKSLYTGVFYERNILGRWVVADGLVYPNFGDGCIVDDAPPRGRYYISIDYGTQNPFSAGLWCFADGVATRIREYYYSGRDTAVQRTDEDYCDAVDALADGLPIEYVVVDPSAASFIAALRRRGRYTVRKAKNEVLDGIRLTAAYLQNGKIKIHRSCADCIREFKIYRWDTEASMRGKDTVVKENDHAMDDVRYFANTILVGLVGNGDDGRGEEYETYGGIML